MSENTFNIIPEPFSVIEEGKGCDLNSLCRVRISSSDRAVLDYIDKNYPSAEKINLNPAENGYFAEISDGAGIDPESCPDKPDAYSLKADCHGVRIDANDENGLFYGIQTLKQLPNEVPGLRITDFAAIKVRMLHWDLKGYLPKFDVLLNELEILASYKINSILLEIEDKYDYRCAPDVGVEGAYTFEQMRELSRTAAYLHIKIVPKLQSIAHVDYLLKHDRYRSLRSSSVFQYDITNPAVKKLWEDMCSELIECFAEHGPYFHIGADECAVTAESYRKRVGECVDFLCEKGWTPIMWDDIVRNSGKSFTPGQEEELRRQLGEKAIFMYWAYGYGGSGNELPYVEEYSKSGLKVWGASGFAGCDNWAGSTPPMIYRAANIDAWTEKAAEYNLEGVCATGWTRIGSADCPAEAQESCWFTSLYAAYSMWSGRKCGYREFICRLMRRFYGIEPDEKLADVIMNIAAHPYDFGDARNAENRNDRIEFLRYACALEKLADKRGRLLNYFQYFDGKLGSKHEDYRRTLVENYTKSLRDELEKDKSDTERVYSKFYMPVTVEEIVRTRFGYLEKLANEMLRQLDNTALV